MRKRVYGLLTALTLALGAPSAAAALPNFTWSGQGGANNPFWSNAKNWKGGAVPNGSVGRLTFPRLGAACSPSTPSMKACYLTGNDVSGLTVHGISLDDAEGYSLSGDAITLGAGGITAVPQTTHCPCGTTALGFPIALSAAQTWTIDGGAAHLGFMDVRGNVTGASHALHIILKNGANLNLTNLEVGPLSITSPPSRNPFENGVVLLPNMVTSMNGSDGKSVRVSDMSLASARAVVGSLTASNHAVLWDAGFQPAGSLTVHGTVSLDSTSEVLAYVTHAGSKAGKDYWQLKASRNVALGGSHLVISTSNKKGFGPDQPCPRLNAGDVETLVSTTGTVRERFEGVSRSGASTGPIGNGATVPITCRAKRPPKVKIHYTRHTVTATVQ